MLFYYYLNALVNLIEPFPFFKKENGSTGISTASLFKKMEIFKKLEIIEELWGSYFRTIP